MSKIVEAANEKECDSWLWSEYLILLGYVVCVVWQEDVKVKCLRLFDYILCKGEVTLVKWPSVQQIFWDEIGANRTHPVANKEALDGLSVFVDRLPEELRAGTIYWLQVNSKVSRRHSWHYKTTLID